MRIYILFSLCVLVLIGINNQLLGRTLFAKTIPQPTNKPIKLLNSDISNTSIIQDLIRKKNWNSIKNNIANIKHPLLKKILLWQYYISPNSGAKFYEIETFLKNHLDWPLTERLRQRAEEAMRPKMSPDSIINWFADRQPLTPDGGIRLGEAFLKVLQKQKAIQIFRKTWIEGNFGAKQERQFYRRYRHFLTKEDHLSRIERLLWKGRYYPVRRMLNKVNKDYRALAFARITLRQYRGGVDRAISAVPKHLINDSGLIFERFRWRRRKGRDINAIELLKDLPQNLGYLEYWWREKAILTRRLLQKGHISDAYNLAKKHGLSIGKSFVEAEWMAGWIALRFLNNANEALEHFEAVFNGSKYPISRARGAYWAGRASETLHNIKQAKDWYAKAARYSLTYYGQQALVKINTDNVVRISNESDINGVQNYAFQRNELVKVVNILGKMKVFDLIKPFIIKLSNLDSSAAWHNKVAVLARKNGRPDLAVFTAKKAYRSGVTIIKEGYPVFTIRGDANFNWSLLFALIRQESAFNNKAISRAGARGLMQIMPSTARQIAKINKIKYHKNKLTTNSAYNLKLGKIYLSGLLSKFDSSLVLSLAAYNAGPARVYNWIKRNGDPRSKDVDTIDWVELIPYKETRNYIQRVIENYNVYKVLLDKQ